MSPQSHLTTPLIVSLLISIPAFAQGTPTPPPAQAPATGNDQVQDWTSSTLSTPSPAPQAQPPAAPPTQPAQPAIAATTAPPPPPPPAAARPKDLSVPPPPEATKRIRQGFYMRIVSAPAIVSLSGTGPRGNAKLGGFGSTDIISFGGSVAPGWVLGGTLQTSAVTTNFSGGPFAGSTVTTADGKTFAASKKAMAGASSLGLMLDWYPNPSGGWHVGLNAGLGGVAVQNFADDSSMFGGGLAGGLFGGYDWSIGKAWSIGLELSVSGTTSAKMKDTDDSNIDTHYRLHSLSVGLGASILYF